MFETPLFLSYEPAEVLAEEPGEGFQSAQPDSLSAFLATRCANASKPWLSVVMPIHHGEPWLGATFDSIVEGDARGIEIIFIDSSADDLSVEIAEKYRDRLDIIIHRRADLKPWTDKTNYGVATARADHVVMLHQDDIWLPNRIEQLRQWIDAAPAASVQFAPTAIIDHAGRTMGIWRCPLDAGPVGRDTLLRRLLVQCFVSVPAPVFRRDAFIATGGMESALWYTADWDLWLKLATAGSAIYRSEVTTGFRVHGQSLTITGSRVSEDFEAQLRRVLDRHTTNDQPRSRLADASVRINVGLAEAAAGSGWALLRVLRTMAALGPVSLIRYFRYSRLLERSLPRLRAGLIGAR